MNKYHNQPTKYNGKRFDSKREAERYAELKLLERAGQITGLKTQVRYLLIPSQYENGKCIFRSTSYVADFVYWQDGKLIVEDAKGMQTDVYRIKKKLMYLQYKIKVREV